MARAAVELLILSERQLTFLYLIVSLEFNLHGLTFFMFPQGIHILVDVLNRVAAYPGDNIACFDSCQLRRAPGGNTVDLHPFPAEIVIGHYTQGNFKAAPGIGRMRVCCLDVIRIPGFFIEPGNQLSNNGKYFCGAVGIDFI